MPSNAPGVYVVARSADPAALSSQLAAVDQSAVQLLLDTRPGLTVDGARPSLEALCDRLKSMWLPDETVIYVGLAGTSLQTRVSQFYRTRLGARSPHAGGWPIKCIGDLSATWVHFGECDKVRDTETDILGAFMSEVTPDARASVLDPGLPLPFANLEFRDSAKRRHVKLHGIKGATASRMRMRLRRRKHRASE